MAIANAGGRSIRRRLPLSRLVAPFTAIMVLASTACSRADEAGTDTAAAPGSVSGAAPSSGGTGLSGSDEQRVASYRLSMDRVEKWAQAIDNLQAISENDPEMRRWAERNDANTSSSLRNMRETLESSPKIRSAIERAGISAEDFVLTQLTLLQAAMVAGLQKGGVTQLPPNVSEDNVKFYRENEARLTQLIEGLQERDR